MSLSLGRIHKLAAMAPSSTFRPPPPHSLFPKEQETAQTDRNSICWGMAKWQRRNTGIWSPFLSGWCSSFTSYSWERRRERRGCWQGTRKRECAGTLRLFVHFSHITPHTNRRCLERCTPSPHTRTHTHTHTHTHTQALFWRAPKEHSYQQSRLGQQIRTKAKEQRMWIQHARLWQPANAQTCACSSIPIWEYAPKYSLLILFTLWII